MTFPVPIELVVFMTGAFVAAFVAGLSGFAFGMVAAAIWLHALAPVQATALIVANALLVQGYAVWKLRRALVPARLWPFILGSAAGIPLGIALLGWVAAGRIKLGVGALLVAFSAYNLWRPRLPNVAWTGRLGDGCIGVLNGALGGATGLGGILPTIWTGLRGWPRDEQRAVFQPTAVATFLMCLLAFAGSGIVVEGTVTLFLLGLPALGAGTALGWIAYGKLDEILFRKVVQVLLLLSGAAILFAR